MANRHQVPALIPTDPLSLPCPFCGARKSKDCATLTGGFSVVHVLRLQAAASLDVQAAKQNSPRKPKGRRPTAARTAGGTTEDR